VIVTGRGYGFARMCPARFTRSPVPRRLALAIGAAVALITAAACGAEAPGVVTDLAGGWFARDTFQVRYHGVDSLPRVFTYVNAYPLWLAAVDESTFAFQVRGGTQTRVTVIVGGDSTTTVVTDIDLDGRLHIRGETAHVELLGKLPLRSSRTDALDSRRALPEPECLANLGPQTPLTPTPVCSEAHHWIR
jgi:hypothetical protein